MNACDCLILTSDWEGSPTVVKEALACNLPVVTVDVGDVRDLLAGVEPSRIVPDQAEALGDALIEVLRLDARSDGWRRAEDMSERRTTDRVTEILHQVVKSSSSARPAFEERAAGEKPVEQTVLPPDEGRIPVAAPARPGKISSRPGAAR